MNKPLPKPAAEIGTKGRKTFPARRSTLRGVMEIVHPLISQVEALRQDVSEREAVINSLQDRLARVEQSSRIPSSYHPPQSLVELRPRELPPPGMTAMQSIMGQLDVEETTEELLAQLKVQ